MKSYIKIALYAGFGLALFFMVSVLLKECSEKPPSTAFVQVTEHIGQSATEYHPTSTLKKKTKERFDGVTIENPTIINKAEYTITNLSQNKTAIYKKDADGQEYLFHEIKYIEPDGKEGPPVGFVKVYKNGTVVSKLYDHTLTVHTAVSKEKDLYKIYNTADFTLKETPPEKDGGVDWVDVPYKLPITNAESQIALSELKKSKIVFAFSPDLGVNTICAVNNGNVDIRPNLGFSLLGLKKHDMQTYKFLRIGVGFSPKDRTVDFSLSPVLYNLGNNIGFIKNTYIGPTIGTDLGKNINLGGAIVLNF